VADRRPPDDKALDRLTAGDPNTVHGWEPAIVAVIGLDDGRRRCRPEDDYALTFGVVGIFLIAAERLAEA
jgi:hypothetical protein